MSVHSLNEVISQYSEVRSYLSLQYGSEQLSKDISAIQLGSRD